MKTEKEQTPIDKAIQAIKDSIPETFANTPMWTVGVSDGKRQAIDILLSFKADERELIERVHDKAMNKGLTMTLGPVETGKEFYEENFFV